LFAALSETLHSQVRKVTGEKNEMVEEANRIIKVITQMEKALDDSRNPEYSQDDEDLKVTYPLVQCLQVLKEKHNAISRIHKERFEQVKSKTSTRELLIHDTDCI
jgi:Ase1/PRC1/MAP65 family protein